MKPPFDHYLECLDRKDILSFERDLRNWIDKCDDNKLILELRRIWFRILDGDLEGTKTMVFELQEQYFDHWSLPVEKNKFYDRRLKEKGF